MKIGITCDKIIFPGNIRIFTNGHHFNVLLWYHFFEKCGFEVVFLSPSEKTRTICNNGRIYNVINYVEYINKSENKILELDCLFMAGLVDESLSKYMKEQNIYIVLSFQCGRALYMPLCSLSLSPLSLTQVTETAGGKGQTRSGLNLNSMYVADGRK